MATGVISWSQTAASNANADGTVNFAEGQAPNSINDSARALMASVAKYRDDIAGAIVSTGVGLGAYNVTSYQGFQSLSQMNGQVIAFTPHTTNGGAVTLSVDGLPQKALRSAPNTELPAGTIIQGTPYLALFNNSDGAFYLHGFFNNPYNIPIGCSIDFWGSTAPNSSFVLAYGQAVSRTTYAGLFALFGTTYGTGDGSTTFNIPDLRGRFVAGADGMGGPLAGRLNATGGMNGVGIGAVGGAQTHTLTLGELPTGITSSGTNTISVTTTSSVVTGVNSGFTPVQNPGSGSWGFNNNSPSYTTVGASGSNSISVTSNNTSGAAHSIVPPTIVANKLLRII